MSDRQRSWERVLSDPNQAGRLLVVDVGNTIGGFASFGPCRDDDGSAHVGELAAQLHAIYLDPRYWNCGLGRRLHDEAMAALSGDGYQMVTLWVLRTNARARRFYEQARWSLDGGTKVDHVRGVALEEVRYVKCLGREL